MSDGLFSSQRTTFLKMINGRLMACQRCTEKNRRWWFSSHGILCGKSQCITVFAKEIDIFLFVGNGEKISLVFRKNNSSLRKHNPIHKILSKLMLFYRWDH